MRWCHVAAEADLPSIYHTLANTKKGRIRLVIQTAVEEALNNLNYLDDFPVSTTLATKLQELKWHLPHPANLAIGVNLFCLGSLDEDTMEQQGQLNHHADALYRGNRHLPYYSTSSRYTMGNKMSVCPAPSHNCAIWWNAPEHFGPSSLEVSIQ